MKLLFRSFVVLVGGLLLVAVLLDFGFRQLQLRDDPGPDRWLLSTLSLIETELAAVPAEARDARAASLADVLGVSVQVFARDEIHMRPDNEPLTPLVDADGNRSYLHVADSLDAVVRLGPIPSSEPNPLLRMLPPIFYLSIFVVVGLWLRPLLRDINAISNGANRFAADYREPLSTADQTTELRSLARNLDAMAARLSGVLRSQKELIAALSHEMRTPLARIRFALAVLGEKTDPRLRGELDAMNDDIEEIDDLVGAMLDYARLDHPDTQMRWQDVPACSWLQQIVAKAPANVIITTNVDITVKDVRMDARLMELAVSNLLVNGARYAGARLHCTLRLVDASYVLSVEDDGAGVPDEAKEKVFKAFARIDDSRNRDTGGYGLGLAVVARVAELHGGHASVDRSPEFGGARFQIHWRRQESENPPPQ